MDIHLVNYFLAVDCCLLCKDKEYLLDIFKAYSQRNVFKLI